jgi:hypothetical protein
MGGRARRVELPLSFASHAIINGSKSTPKSLNKPASHSGGSRERIFTVNLGKIRVTMALF